MNLFEHDYGTASTTPDETDITTTILYFSTPELREFKKLCKAGIKKEFGESFQTKGNVSDLLLIMLRKQYAANENHS